MFSITLKLTLKDDMVLSETSATAGVHGSLDYIPGANLLGAMAAQTYSNLSKTDQAWSIFHSAKVRFGNALPLANPENLESVGFPMPLCIHTEKSNDKAFQNLIWVNDGDNAGTQMKQKRGGYLTANAQTFAPKMHYSMRTAIDAQTGTAAESQLFGYQALRAGQSFISTIQCDEANDFEQVKAFFQSAKTLRLGRSRSAQYGRVNVSVVKADAADKSFAHHSWQLKDNLLVIWLASDCIVNDEFGHPTLNPSGQDVGLSSGKLLLDKSFIRTRQVSAFNATRKHYDMTRQAIVKGSVLVFEQCSLTQSDHQKLTQGIGIGIEQGFGQVVPHALVPSILFEQKPALTTMEPITAQTSVQTPKSVLAQNLQNLLKEDDQLKTARQAANSAFKILLEHYASGRNFTGTPVGVAFGPSNTQWGAIREVAQNLRNAKSAELLKHLKDICKPNDEDWGADIGSSNDQPSFSSWLLSFVEAEKVDYEIADFLRILAHKASQSSELDKIRLGTTDKTQNANAQTEAQI